ncbi:hypothetical protein BU14_0891s0001 [Porphyra umbilicalis]|uniref:Uncharacterized protein n=1 Tax=Porphyra umbilicalis TaxID=2786 RepID=A0A1X6NNR2_PORUM|nr:hypothetical protein BU14_0891s0001 [Porphyra umbilicalis]|eukprot:OSX70126.1 hypothetical protein BU14_0891s0001 [Porphyra umbilicalis]
MCDTRVMPYALPSSPRRVQLEPSDLTDGSTQHDPPVPLEPPAATRRFKRPAPTGQRPSWRPPARPPWPRGRPRPSYPMRRRPAPRMPTTLAPAQPPPTATRAGKARARATRRGRSVPPTPRLVPTPVAREALGPQHPPPAVRLLPKEPPGGALPHLGGSRVARHADTDKGVAGRRPAERSHVVGEAHPLERPRDDRQAGRVGARGLVKGGEGEEHILITVPRVRVGRDAAVEGVGGPPPAVEGSDLDVAGSLRADTPLAGDAARKDEQRGGVGRGGGHARADVRNVLGGFARLEGRKRPRRRGGGGGGGVGAVEDRVARNHNEVGERRRAARRRQRHGGRRGEGGGRPVSASGGGRRRRRGGARVHRASVEGGGHGRQKGGGGRPGD